MSKEEKAEYHNNLILLEKERERLKEHQQEFLKLAIEIAARNTELFTKQFRKSNNNKIWKAEAK